MAVPTTMNAINKAVTSGVISVLPVSRWIRVSGRRDGVRVTDSTIPAMNDGFAPTASLKDLFCPFLGLSLSRVVRTGALRSWGSYFPAALRVRHDMAATSLAHPASPPLVPCGVLGTGVSFIGH